MAEEFIQDNYYHSSRTKFIDTHISTKCGIEWWLSRLLFNNEPSRVVYATPDIAFRKRIETLDKGKNDEEPLKPEMLNLPYATYYQLGDPEPDDRVAAVNAHQSLVGEYQEEFDRNIRSLAVMTKYKITCYFSRRDDVRQAGQLLLWEKEPKYPIKLYHDITYRGVKLSLPVFMTIESINTNPDYKETEWLNKNRIFMVDVEVSVRSYQLLINNINNIIQLPIRFKNFIDDYDDENPTESVLTEEVVLQWAANKFAIDLDVNKIDESGPEYSALLKSPYFEQVPLTETEQARLVANVPTEYTTDVIKAYWQRDTKCVLNSYYYNEAKSTPDTAHIKFKVKPSTFNYWDKMILSIPTKDDVVITDCHDVEAYFPGLYPNSEYTMTIRLWATDGTLQVYYLTFTTPNSEDNEAPQPEKINKAKGLVGLEL